MPTIDLSDKLSLMNEALVATGNTPVAPGDEQTDEYITASMAFDQEAELLRYRRNWKFATTFQNLTRAGDSAYPGFSDVYDKPADCLYLVNVYRQDQAALVIPSLTGAVPVNEPLIPPLGYRIVANQIHTVADATVGVTAIYIPFLNGAEPWSMGFRSVLRLKMQAYILRALNEDNQEAALADKLAEMALTEASARSDQEEPRRVSFRSSVLEARRARRRGIWP